MPFFEIYDSHGLIGAAEDASNEVANRGFTECEIATFSILNGKAELLSNVPLVNTIVFVDATQEEIIQETMKFMNS